MEISRAKLIPLLFAGWICNCQGQDLPLLDPLHPAWANEGPRYGYTVQLKTSKGIVVLAIYTKWAPLGSKRFYNLVQHGFFDDSRFYRVRAGEFVQFGIPGDPNVAKVWEHQAIDDDAVNEKNVRGTIAFAMTGPNTRTTQLFINLKDNLHLDLQGFVPIGKVIQGMDVLEMLYSEYGEMSGGGMRGGKQGKLFEEGNLYLDREFPKLDKLLSAKAVEIKIIK